jgi:hypothetical protein
MILGREIQLIGKSDPKGTDGTNLDGTYEHYNRTVIYDHDLPIHAQIETILHECAHSHITFTGWDQKLNEREVELLCQLMANYATDMILGLSQESKRTYGRRKDKK